MEKLQLVCISDSPYATPNAGPDYAVLVMAVHCALQVFHPFTQVNSDGLFTHRLCVYAGALLIPSLMAGLAFINSDWGYVSLGAFCTLPIRPFWYRLAWSGSHGI